MSDITKVPQTDAQGTPDEHDWQGAYTTIHVGEAEATEAAPPTDLGEFAPEGDAIEELPVAPRPSLADWLRGRSVDQWVFFGIFALAAVLRFWGLADKPLHHDESLHAYYSWQFLINPSGYQYNPLLHGPFQFHIIPFFYALGHMLGLANNGINDFTARMLPALMGLAMVPMPYFLRHQVGRWGAIAASVLLAVSPAFVYYSRFVRDDIYVTCFTLLIVVAAIQYSQTQRLGWLLAGVAALVLSFTAMENTFFTIAVFGSFFIALVLWDLGLPVGRTLTRNPRWQQVSGGLVLLIPATLIGAALAGLGLIWLGNLSHTINTLADKYKNPVPDPQHPGQTMPDPRSPDAIILHWEQAAFLIAVLVCLVICLVAVAGLVQRLMRKDDFIFAPRWHAWVDPQRQPVLETVLGTDWVRWFLGFVLGVLLFAAFFVDLPKDFLSLTEWSAGVKNGVGRGMLQGIYYWLEQQQVARGGQPWYYYLLLLPLYEPLILVFGLAGVVRAIVQPTRFRLFLVFWFAANMGLYSWAGEKMPWLVIHILLPLLLLAGSALDWVISAVLHGARTWWRPTRVLVALGGMLLVGGLASVTVASTMVFLVIFSVAAIIAVGVAVGVEQWSRHRAHLLADQHELAYLTPVPRWLVGSRQVAALTCLVLAAVLLVPTVWNMQRVNFYDPSVAPNEMLVYVQTTTAVQRTMDKINALDQQLYHGQHKLKIGVTPDAVWPFVWYLSDYPVTFDKNNAWSGGAWINYTATTTGSPPDVIIGGLSDGSQNVPQVFPNTYASQQYALRWWWDESYKLPLCTKEKSTQCLKTPPLGTGVGPLLWLSYGASPPPACADITNLKCSSLNSSPNAGFAAQRYWNWLWQRHNISGVTVDPNSYTDFILYIRTDLTKYVHP